MDINEIKKILEDNKLKIDSLWRSLWHRRQIKRIIFKGKRTVFTIILG